MTPYRDPAEHCEDEAIEPVRDTPAKRLAFALAMPLPGIAVGAVGVPMLGVHATVFAYIFYLGGVALTLTWRIVDTDADRRLVFVAAYWPVALPVVGIRKVLWWVKEGSR